MGIRLQRISQGASLGLAIWHFTMEGASCSWSGGSASYWKPEDKAIHEGDSRLILVGLSCTSSFLKCHWAPCRGPHTCRQAFKRPQGGFGDRAGQFRAWLQGTWPLQVLHYKVTEKARARDVGYSSYKKPWSTSTSLQKERNSRQYFVDPD